MDAEIQPQGVIEYAIIGNWIVAISAAMTITLSFLCWTEAKYVAE